MAQKSGGKIATFTALHTLVRLVMILGYPVVQVLLLWFSLLALHYFNGSVFALGLFLVGHGITFIALFEGKNLYSESRVKWVFDCWLLSSFLAAAATWGLLLLHFPFDFPRSGTISVFGNTSYDGNEPNAMFQPWLHLAIFVAGGIFWRSPASATSRHSL